MYLAGALTFAVLGQWELLQRENPATLWPGLIFYGIALCLYGFLLRRDKLVRSEEKPIPWVWETGAFTAILALALFMRVYRLGQFPAGIFPDEACEGWGSLKILNEGWRPFYEIYQLSVWDIPVYYLLAIWFKFWTPTQEHFFLFSAFFSVITLPLVYWTFRQLAGTRLALLTLFILAVSRWDMTYARNCHPAFQIHFYMFGALAFWLYYLKIGKNWAFWVSAVFCAGGYYVYQAYKPFLLVMVGCFVYESLLSPRKWKFGYKKMIGYFGLTVLLTAPLWLYLIRIGSWGRREQELFIFPGILQGGSLKPLFLHISQTLLMFNREGDLWFLHNLPYHRMLDDVTGVLWILGFFTAFTQIKERRYFYCLLGFGFMILPTLLSVNATHASRAFGTIPFICFLAAAALNEIGEKTLFIFGRHVRLAVAAGAALLLGFMAFENFNTYFNEQAKDESCWRDPDTDATRVGKMIAENGDQYDYFLSSHFYGRYATMFLGYAEKNQTHELDIPSGLFARPRPGRGLLFAVEDKRDGVLSLLQTLYPGGETLTERDLEGSPLVHFYKVSPEAVKADQGLKPFSGSGFSSFTGSVWLPGGTFRFNSPDAAPSSWTIGSRKILNSRSYSFTTGIYPLSITFRRLKSIGLPSLLAFAAQGAPVTLDQTRLSPVLIHQGLLGQYHSSGGLYRQLDPVLNFSFRNDFPVRDFPPLQVQWTGNLAVNQPGTYQFLILTSDDARFFLDQAALLETGNRESAGIDLQAGLHPLRVEFSKTKGVDTILHLLWKRPGEKNYEIIPAGALEGRP